MEHNFGIGVESTYDTLVAPDVWLELVNEAIRLEPQVIPVETIRAIGTRIYKTVGKTTRGSFSAIANYQDVPTLFYLLGGTVSTTGAGPYDHVIPESPVVGGMASLPLSVEVQRDEGGDGDTFQYSGCVLTELTIAFETNSVIEVSGQILGSGTETNGAASSTSYRDFDVSLPTELSLTLDAVARDVERFEVTISWPHDEPRKLGSAVFARKPKPTGPMQVSGSFTLLNHSPSLYTLFKASTVCDIQLVAGDGTHSFILNLNECTLTEGTPQLDGPGVPKPVVTFVVAEDSALASPFQMIATNDVATLP